MARQRQCPCGTPLVYDACCGRLHRGEEVAATAVALMRARYSAYALADLDYVFRTWHPRTRPAELTLDTSVRWLSLQIVDVVGGGERDEAGDVEFVARYHGGELRERSRFTRRAGRWVYLDGSVTRRRR